MQFFATHTYCSKKKKTLAHACLREIPRGSLEGPYVFTTAQEGGKCPAVHKEQPWEKKEEEEKKSFPQVHPAHTAHAHLEGRE